VEAQAFGGDTTLTSERRLHGYEVVLMDPLGIERRRRRRETAV
jgi:hypothetical protein